jgi:hypothetical protein
VDFKRLVLQKQRDKRDAEEAAKRAASLVAEEAAKQAAILVPKYFKLH